MNSKKKKSQNLRYAICVSGASETSHCAEGAMDKAIEIGREIARRDFILVTGATTGMPYWAAKGAFEAGGTVIGFSPAASKAAHQKTYHLPIDYHDVILYTGFGYPGRNLLLTRSSDAIITICGRMGTLNEFTIAFEDQKPIGVLEGTGGTADIIKDLIVKSYRGPGKIAYARDPIELLDQVVELIKKEEI